jgi:hypothetical protein
MNLGQIYNALGVRRSEVAPKQLKPLVKAALVQAHRTGDAGRMRFLSQAKERVRHINGFNKCWCGVTISKNAGVCRAHRNPLKLAA